MSGESPSRAMGAALRTIRNSTDVVQGMSALLACCRAHSPDDEETWEQVEQLDFASDAASIAEE